MISNTEIYPIKIFTQFSFPLCKPQDAIHFIILDLTTAIMRGKQKYRTSHKILHYTFYPTDFIPSFLDSNISLTSSSKTPSACVLLLRLETRLLLLLLLLYLLSQVYSSW